MQTRNKIIVIGTLAIMTLIILAGYLALIYIPAWYVPEYVDPMDQQKLRDDFTSLTTKINQGMQHPKPFELAIAARDVNRFISGLAYLDPQLKDTIPSNVMDPAIQFEDDYLKVGAVVDQDGKQVFASFWIRVRPQENWLVLDTLKVKVGLYPVPMSALKERIDKLAGKKSKFLPDVRGILESGQYPNRFRYPNSDYDFRITHLRARDGILYLTIEPIPRVKK